MLMNLVDLDYVEMKIWEKMSEECEGEGKLEESVRVLEEV
jgi:hypothetical protein